MGFVKPSGRLLARTLAFIFETAKWGSRAGGCQNDADPELSACTPTREQPIHLKSGPNTNGGGGSKWSHDLCVRLFIYLQIPRTLEVLLGGNLTLILYIFGK